MSEKLPVSDFHKVVDHVTIFRSKKWWEAVAIIESIGKHSIAMHMWQFRDGKVEEETHSFS